ncbi:MAG: hypothetical protein ACR652_25655 [Methylocystis sp.]|uniref:hypothetical protein n=1 Tax=Methylocystis sp. TaxID=1911079 RepID=UPI003DA33AE2
MAGGYITIEDYIRGFEPFFIEEIGEQAKELGPWIEEREKELGLPFIYDKAGQRLFQKGLVAWAFSSAGPTCFG